MSRLFITLFFLLTIGTTLIAQSIECSTYFPLTDSIGKPFLKDTFFLREVGIKQDDETADLPNDRLLQYPFFIPYRDTLNLFDNYESGFFTYIDAFSLMKDSFKNRGISFKEGTILNSKFASVKSLDTIRQTVKFIKRGNYRRVKKVFFEYELYKLKINAVYIGKYCRKVPYSIIGKNRPMFIDKPVDVYVILDIVQ